MITLLNDMKISRVLNAQTAAETALSSSVLDMSGFDSVIFIALLNTVTSGCVLTLAAKSNPTNSSSGGTSEGSCTVTDAGGATSNGLMATEIIRPTQRYVFAYLTRTTDNAQIDGILAIQYNSKNMPETEVAAMVAYAIAGPNA